MATSTQYKLLEYVHGDMQDHRRFGGTWFVDPPVHAGSELSLLDRFIGVRDLMVFKDGEREEVRWVGAPPSTATCQTRRWPAAA